VARITDIFYAFIVFPAIFLVTLLFVFSSSLTDIQVQQLRFNCPYPLLNKNVTDIQILDNTHVQYNATEFSGAQDASVVRIFRCGEDGAINVSLATYTYSSGFFDAQQAFIGYLSASMSAFFDQIANGANILILFLNAPAEISGLAFFTYIEILLFVFISFGTFMVLRG
jgi:hypothetical protein